MKTFILLTTFFCSVFSELYTPEQQVLLKNIVNKCRQDTKIELPMLNDFMNRRFANDDVLKNFIFCFYKGLGVMKEDGTVDKEALLKFAESLKDSTKAAFTTCVDEQGANGPETAFIIAKCYMAGLPKDEYAGVKL